jgi:hypothetical protein
MAYENCILEVQKIAGRTLTPDETSQVSKTVEKIIKKLDKSDLSGDLGEQVMKAINDFTQDLKASAVIEKRNAALNARHKIEKFDYLMNVFGDDPSEGIKAILGDSLVDRQGSKNGVAHHVKSLEHEYLGGLTAKLSKEGVLDIASSGKFDDQIFRAMYELNMDKPDMAVIKKLAPEAVKVAEVFNMYGEMSRNKANGAGAWIKKLPGYVVKRSHDLIKIREAAGPGIALNDPRHEKAWVDWVMENNDWEKGMADVPIEERGKVLSSMFQQFSNGYHLKFGEGGSSGLKGAFNIGKSLSHERVLQFKTPEAEFEYHKRFGQGDSLLENMASGLSKMARDTAIMTKLGPNAKANLDEVIDMAMKKYDAEGKGSTAAELKKNYDATMSTLWPNITGETAIPGNQIWAQRSSTFRTWQMMCDLASATLSGLTDIPFFASAMRYTGERNTGSFFHGMKDAVEGIVGRIGKDTTPDQMKTFSEMGILTGVLSDPFSKFASDIPGRTAAGISLLMKLNGMNFWQDSLRIKSVMATANRHAEHAHLSFNELPSGMQAIMKQFEVSPAAWDLIRKTEIKVDPEGYKLLTPENVDSISDDEISKAITGSVTPAKIKNFRETLKNNYRTLFSQIAGMATSEPTVVERSIMNRGTKPGTWEGEALRHFWMYKSFMTSVMRKHIGRELMGYDADRLPAHKALARMMSSGNMSGGFGGMVNMITFGTLAGYGSMILKDAAKGREPRVPTDAKSFSKIFLAAAAQSGSFGIYGDFLFGEAKDRYGQQFFTTLAGPTARRAMEVGDLYGKLKAKAEGKMFDDGGDSIDVGSSAMRLALNNLPGYNLFYTRWALDYAIMYRMQEMMNPGYLRRMEGNLKKEKQQEMLVPPSTLIPHGG